MTANAKKVQYRSDLTSLLGNAAGYRKSHILLTAISLDVFTTLESLAQTNLKAVSSALGAKERSVEKLLGGLVALDLVDFDGSSYRNSKTSQVYLNRNSPYYLGEGIRNLFDIGQDTWGSLTSAIKLGNPIAVQRTDEIEANFWPKLTASIRPFNIPVAECAAKLLKWKGRGIRKVLDLGGGSGVFGKEFLKVFPDAKVIQVDWPQVNAEARRYNKDAFNAGRFITIDGDLFETPWEQEGVFDVVILSHIIHQEDMARCKTLTRRIGNCIDENSEIIINEFCVNEARNYPPYSLIFGLSMVLQNPGGGVYSYTDINEILGTIGHEVYFASSPVPPSTLCFSRSVKKGKDFASNLTRTSSTSKPKSVPTNGGSKTAPGSFLSRDWDKTEASVLKNWLTDRFRQQVDYASKNSQYWAKRLSKFLSDVNTFTTETIERIPVLMKSELRVISPFDLATSTRPHWHVVRGSGGTTGTPTNVLWSEGDWRAAIETSTRFLRDVRDWTGLKIWNGYNQAHVAGPAFDDIIRSVGGTPIPRHFKATDKEAIKEMEHMKINAMVLTPKSGSGKGGSLEDFLSIDPNFISRLKIKNLWVSSTILEKELVSELRDLGVETITNFYGSTESMPNAISCSADPHTFHICQGHIYLEVLDPNGRHVKSGERGTVVVSRIASSQEGRIGPAEATQLFRFVVGDSAVFDSSPCACGLKTARIGQIERLPFDEGKVLGGCERWD